jgi:hypothetical protein
MVLGKLYGSNKYSFWLTVWAPKRVSPQNPNGANGTRIQVESE